MKKLLLLSIAILFVSKINAQTYYTSSNATPVAFGMASTLTIPAGDTVYISDIPENVYGGTMEGSTMASVHAQTPVYFMNISNYGSLYMGASSSTAKKFKFVAHTYTFSVNDYTQYNISAPAGGSLVFFTQTGNGVGIKENYLNKINLSVYPNPANEMIIVESEMINKKTEIKIVDLLGKTLIYNLSLTTHNLIDVSGLKSGIYFLQVFEEGNLVGVQKVVKE